MCLPLKPNLQGQQRGPANLQALAESQRAPQIVVCAQPQVGTCPGLSRRLLHSCGIQEHKPCWPQSEWIQSQPQKPETHKGAKHPCPLEAVEGEVKWQLLGSRMEKAMAPHSSTLAWKIPWTEEPGRLQSMVSQRVGHD